MKCFSFVIIFILSSLFVNGQCITWELKMGYGFYDLSEVKSLQLEFLENTDLPNAMPVENFPNSLFYYSSINYLINQENRIGIDFSYYSTGGRNHIADYSGEYKLDMLLNGYRIGTRYQNNFLIRNKLVVGLQLGCGLIVSNLKINEMLIINNEEIANEKAELSGTGLFLEPLLTTSYKLFRGIGINLNIGYEIDFKGELKVKHYNNERIGTVVNWSGLRISLGIAYSLNLEKNN